MKSICLMLVLTLATSMARYRAFWEGEGREDTSRAWDRKVEEEGGEDEDTPLEVQNID